jgi:hypothetical protein
LEKERRVKDKDSALVGYTLQQVIPFFYSSGPFIIPNLYELMVVRRFSSQIEITRDYTTENKSFALGETTFSFFFLFLVQT